MFELPDVMRVAQTMARHAATRHGVIAQNIAQADTPGYKAQDIAPFRDAIAAQGPKATRATHINGSAAAADFAPITDRAAPNFAPNGNTVSLEREMMRAAETRQSHDLALAVYSSTRGILRAALGR